MNKFFYQKIALNNLKKNSNVYLPFVLTAVGTVAMFYSACFLAYSTNSYYTQIKMFMMLCVFVTAIFSAFFLFYTNNFLVKRRKKEWGLYNILGMEKKHIARISIWENLFVSLFSIISGLVIGIILSQLFVLVLNKILNLPPTLDFSITLDGLTITAILFAVIFTFILIKSVIVVYRAKPIELLYGSNVGEGEPRSNWFTAIIGIVTLLLGYSASLIKQDPMQLIGIFFLAALLVIIGTFCLFSAGSIAFLKILKKNKGYYYKTKNFTAISGMIYRMRQNAMGLASICIMSTAVLVMISTSVSLYVGLDDSMDTRYPFDVILNSDYSENDEFDNNYIYENLTTYLDGNNIDYGNIKNYTTLFMRASNSNNNYNHTFTAENIMGDTSFMVFLTQQDYASYSGNKMLNLGENEVAVYSSTVSDTISILGKSYTVKEQFSDDLKLPPYSAYMKNVIYVILPDASYIKDINSQLLLASNGESYGDLEENIMFDFTSEQLEDISFNYDTFGNNLSNGTILGEIDGGFNYTIKQQNYDDFMSIYGGLLFLGIFLGFLFLMATVLIIYYKQIVEGFEDRKRFEIMQKIGMSHSEVKQSVKAQILTVFALPLIVATLHLAVSFPILIQLLAFAFTLPHTQVHIDA